MPHNVTRLNVTFEISSGSMQLNIGEEKDMSISTEDPLGLAASQELSNSKSCLIYS